MEGQAARATRDDGTAGRWEPPAPEHPARPRGRVARAVVVAAVVVLFLVCGVLVTAAVASDTGPAGLVVGLTLAALPVIPVVAAFLWLDRYEAEPPSLLLFAFGWGALVATLVALVLNTASMQAIAASGGDPTMAAVVVAPVVEETAKGLAVVGVLVLRHREFDGVVDGIVYAGMAGIGFAFVENVLYLGRAFLEAGGAGAAAVFVVRCLFSPFAHPLFTMAIGVAVGVAATRRLRRAWPLVVLGWVVAVVLHGLWNAAAVSGVAGFVSAYVVVQVPIFLAAIALAVLARRREGTVVRRHLDAYAASGWLTPSEVAMLGSLPQRGEARRWAGRSGGPVAAAAMRDFQDLASELAFLRHRMVRGTAPEDAARTELCLLETLWHLRARFLPQRLAG